MHKKALLAFEAVLYIACRGGAEAVSLKDICRAAGVTERYLEQDMQRLVRSGILKGFRGPKGGYLLARERRKISLHDICRSVAAKEEKGGSVLAKEVIKPFAEKLDEAVETELVKLSIEDLYEKAKEKGIDRILKHNSDFNI